MRKLLPVAMGLLAGLLVWESSVDTSLAADYQWSYYGGNRYAVTETYRTWALAQAEAELAAPGGHLAAINDAGENSWLSQFIGVVHDCHVRDYPGYLIDTGHPGGGIPNNDNLAWIGLIRTGASWSWVTAEPVAYWNQYTGPGGFTTTGTHAYLLGSSHPYGPGQWDACVEEDTVYKMNPRGIIEAPVPEPSALILLTTGTLALLAYARRRGHGPPLPFDTESKPAGTSPDVGSVCCPLNCYPTTNNDQEKEGVR